ncbi:COG4223 family protein [Pseudothioclava nitratireducens]|uniref:COG4223 family protein n=1 Tax=Pseudothioclava nitratireducens TaxID=1928646 RepID=UPI0023DA6884|nr:mitofilin family membrane protein [Defluviimonas nitratireducens]MDF1619943.1 mitofilin family membrane protein [Defluviimonas nitratireducens]
MAKPRTRKTTTPEATEADIPEAEVVATVTEDATSQESVPDTPESIAEESEPVVAEEPVTEVDAPPEDSVSEDVVLQAPADPRARRASFWPMVLGGVCAAALGAGAVVYALPKLPPQLAGFLPQAEGEADAAAMRALVDTQAARIEALAAELETLRATPAPNVDLTPLEQQAADLGAALAGLDQRVNALEKRPVEGGGASATALEAFEREMQDLRALVEENRAAGSQTQQEIEAAAAAAQAKIAAAEEEAAALRAEAEAGARKAIAQAALSRLAAALDSGAPIAPIVADLSGAGVDVPAVLQGEVPSLAALQDGFDPAARAALNTARLQATDGSVGDRLGAFLLAQTGARSLTPQEGDDADAVLSRARAAVMNGDLAAALTEIGVLDAAPQAEMADWVAQAQARVAAGDALNALAASLN